MLKFSRLPIGLLALTIAAPVFAQPATTTANPTPPAGAMAPAMPVAPKVPDFGIAQHRGSAEGRSGRHQHCNGCRAKRIAERQ